MIARLTATTALDGFLAVCSWASVPGTDVDGDMDTAEDTAMAVAATDTDASVMATVDGLDTVTAVALDMVHGLAMPVERDRVTVAAHGLAVTAAEPVLAAAVDSTAAVAGSTAVAADMVAVVTGKSFA